MFILPSSHTFLMCAIQMVGSLSWSLHCFRTTKKYHRLQNLVWFFLKLQKYFPHILIKEMFSMSYIYQSWFTWPCLLQNWFNSKQILLLLGFIWIHRDQSTSFQLDVVCQQLQAQDPLVIFLESCLKTKKSELISLITHCFQSELYLNTFY